MRGCEGDEMSDRQISFDAENWRLGMEAAYQKFPLTFNGIWNDTPDAAEEEYSIEGDLVPDADGGLYLGVGPQLEWDDQDDTYFPTSGNWLTLSALLHGSQIGSDLDYQTYTLDLRHYRALFADVVLAGQLELRSPLMGRFRGGVLGAIDQI
ncbi:MAG: BamA/TamA family outer membrane protein, partial [Candidatus Latescibacteria bacterium]|nr:BamA/TamA family outer membrane protein [Candidatus Latescibacterota bacterium]